MKTFASAAVLSMMLAGTALAQSSVVENQGSQERAPGGTSVIDGNQSGQQQVMPGATGQTGAGSDAAGSLDTRSDQQAATGDDAGSTAGGGSMGGGQDQPSASGGLGSAGDAGTTAGGGSMGGGGQDQRAATGGGASGGSMGGTDQQATTGAGSAGMSGGAGAQGMERQSGLDRGGSGQQAQAGGRDWHNDQAIVRHVQTQLKEGGYDVGQVDGIYGPRTQQALRDFQRDQGHPATGRIDENLLASMNIDSGPQTAAQPGGEQTGGEQTGGGQRPMTQQPAR